MPGGSRPRAGRKPVRINLGDLEKLCALQCTDEEVAAFFDVSERTIERRRQKPAFAEAMERGRAKGRISLRRNLWGLAAKGNPAANIFLAKNLLGYRDVASNEHSGPGGGSIRIDARPDLSRKYYGWRATVDTFRTFLASELVNRDSFEPGNFQNLKTPARIRMRSSRLATQAGHVSNPTSTEGDPRADRPPLNPSRRSIAPISSAKKGRI